VAGDDYLLPLLYQVQQLAKPVLRLEGAYRAQGCLLQFKRRFTADRLLGLFLYSRGGSGCGEDHRSPGMGPSLLKVRRRH